MKTQLQLLVVSGLTICAALMVMALTITSASAQNIFVANQGNDTVSEFNSSGTLLNQFFAPGENSIVGVAVDSSGDLYAVNSGNNTISEFNSSGTLINTISNPSLDDPSFIAISPAPEPPTCALLAAGVAVLLGLRRRAIYTTH